MCHWQCPATVGKNCHRVRSAQRTAKHAVHCNAGQPVSVLDSRLQTVTPLSLQSISGRAGSAAHHARGWAGQLAWDSVIGHFSPAMDTKVFKCSVFAFEFYCRPGPGRPGSCQWGAELKIRPDRPRAGRRGPRLADTVRWPGQDERNWVGT